MHANVADFGLAKRADATDELTLTGEVMGTAAYMAPEQAAGDTKKTTAAADIYSLGAIFYELLTGSPPFTGASAMAVLVKVQNDDPVPPRRKNRAIGPDLNTICLKYLEKKPARRYVSALLLAQDLEAWLGGRPISCRPVTTLERVVRWIRRHPSQAAAAIMAAALIFTSALAYQYSRAAGSARDRPVAADSPTIDLANALLAKGHYEMAREMFEEAVREAETPGEMLDAEEGLRRLANREGEPK